MAVTDGITAVLAASFILISILKRREDGRPGGGRIHRSWQRARSADACPRQRERPAVSRTESPGYGQWEPLYIYPAVASGLSSCYYQHACASWSSLSQRPPGARYDVLTRLWARVGPSIPSLCCAVCLLVRAIRSGLLIFFFHGDPGVRRSVDRSFMLY